PFFMTPDTESIFKKPPDDEDSLMQEHEISSYCVALVRSSDSHLVKLYRGFGDGCASKLVEDIEDAVIQCRRNMPNITLVMSPTAQAHFDSAMACGHCNQPFVNGDKVRHHDHGNGQYLDALCNKCN